MLSKYKNTFRVTRDEIGDPMIKCKQGFVYDYSKRVLGVWLNSEKPNRSFDALKRRWPTLRLAQLGEGEFICLFEPRNDKEAVRFLRSLGAQRQRQHDPATLERRQASMMHARQCRKAV